MSANATKKRNLKYNRYVSAVSPKSSAMQSLIKAFIIGGFTCIIGEFVSDILIMIFPGMELSMIANYTSMILIGVAVLLTGLGRYDIIARHGGAGSFLPITGFANAMASASMEFRTEGLIFGTTVKLFTVVGPVIVNGIVFSTLAGIIRYIVEMII